MAKFWQKGAFKTVAKIGAGVAGFAVGGPAGAALASGLAKAGDKGIKKTLTAKQLGKGVKEGAIVGVASYAAVKAAPTIKSAFSTVKAGAASTVSKAAPSALTAVQSIYTPMRTPGAQQEARDAAQEASYAAPDDGTGYSQAIKEIYAGRLKSSASAASVTGAGAASSCAASGDGSLLSFVALVGVGAVIGFCWAWFGWGAADARDKEAA